VTEFMHAGTVSAAVAVAHKPEILLVEDDPVTRRLIARLLRRAGYAVEEAADGVEALARIQQKFFPILITDWEMPLMDGPTLCGNVRQLALQGYVYTLLLTARNTKEHIIAGLEAGADDYLTKPLHDAELFARIKTGARIVALEQNLRAANEHNRKLSITDALTGAYNRRHFSEQLPAEIERCRRYKHALSIVMSDIDFFKKINDNHGHGAGDEVLGQFVHLIKRSIRSTSDWIARYGGEEFVIVMPETGHAGAMQATEKVRAAIAAEPFATSAGRIAVSASFGVATLTPDGDDATQRIDQLIATADARLYTSKHSGRNRVTGA
jgi:two-component system, cell cycle response regulator